MSATSFFSTSDLIAISAIVVAILAAAPIAYVFLQDANRNSKLRTMEIEVEKMRNSVALYQEAQSNILACIIGIEESVLIHCAIFDEGMKLDKNQQQHADDIVHKNRREVKRLIHHCGLAQLEEESALISSWLLATEFGDYRSAELMKRMEPYRASEKLRTYQVHRHILLKRIENDK